MSRSKTCKLYILDEVNCVFAGLHPDHVGYFYEEHAAFANNYFFNPKFKLGSWDGKIRYFYKTGKTYVNLLEKILPNIKAFGYKVDLIDQRKTAPVNIPFIDKDYFSHIPDPNYPDQPWVMRTYQVDFINTLTGGGSGVGIAGTGAGKTSICAALADVYEKTANLRSIIIVPDKYLTDQTSSQYAYFGLDVGEYSGTTKDLNHNHVVSTWQALQNNPKIIQMFQVIVVDECHGLRGNVLTKLLTEYGKNIAFRFGVTGTLPKGEADVLSVITAVGTVKYNIPAHELIDQGHLAKLDIDIVQLSVDLENKYEEFCQENPEEKITYRKFKDSYFSDYTQEKMFLQGQEKRLEWIAALIETKRIIGKSNVLCLVNGIRVGKKLVKLIPNAHFIYGKDKVEIRKQAYALFKENDDVVVIATVNIAATGIDVPRIFNLMFIDMGKSFIRTIQGIGRGLRKAPDKEYVAVTDICSDLKYSRKHVRERIKFYIEAKYPYAKRLVKY